MTEEELLDLGWRAHVGERGASLQLAMWTAIRTVHDMSIAFIAAAASLSGIIKFMDTRSTELLRERAITLSDYGRIEERVMAVMCSKPFIDLPHVVPLERSMQQSYMDHRRHNKSVTARARAYRGPPPQRHK